MASLQVENWEIDKLIPYARNPRKNDDVVDKMVSAIKEFGFRIPIVAKSDGSVVDGHLRLKAAKRLGMTEVPVALADELTDEQVKAFRILANKSANWAEWDNDLLKLEIDELKLANFNLDLTGFDNIELKNLFDEKGDDTNNTDDGDIPPDDFKYEQKFGVIIECKSESEQKEIYERLTNEGFTCKVVVN